MRPDTHLWQAYRDAATAHSVYVASAPEGDDAAAAMAVAVHIAREALLRHHEPLVLNIAKNVAMQHQHHMTGFDALFNAGLHGLWDVIPVYDPSRGAFSTIAFQYIKGYMLQELRRCRIIGHVRKRVVLESELGSEDSPYLFEETARHDRGVDASIVLELLKRLDARTAAVVRLRYFEGLKYREIAQQVGCSKQRAQQLDSEAIRQMRQWVRLDLDGDAVLREQSLPSRGNRVECVDTGERFESIREAAASRQENHSGLSRALQRGHRWLGQEWRVVA